MARARARVLEEEREWHMLVAKARAATVDNSQERELRATNERTQAASLSAEEREWQQRLSRTRAS